jgi:oligoribonuclease NrnB/cAMP/cGMP phosphodiesterase (DHH superfamily)
MKVMLFTHVDLDGVTPKILCSLVFEEVDVSYCNYINVDKRVKQFIADEKYKDYDKIYITDISVEEDTAELIENTCKDKLLLFDHHISADSLNKYSWAFVKSVEPYIKEDGSIGERKSCGTSLFHTHLIKERYLKNDRKTDDFVEHVRRYDTWDWFEMKDEDSKKLSMLLDIIGRDRFTKKYAYFLQVYNKLWFTEEDTEMLNIEQERMDRYIDGRKRSIIEKQIQGKRTGIVFAEQYKSELGNKLAESTDYDIIVIVDPNLSVSFRCSQDSEVEADKIALVYGGGGHAKAAGFPLAQSIKVDIINTIFSKEE